MASNNPFQCGPQMLPTKCGYRDIYHNVIKKTSTNENKMIEGNTNEHDAERLNVTQMNCSSLGGV